MNSQSRIKNQISLRENLPLPDDRLNPPGQRLRITLLSGLRQTPNGALPTESTPQTKMLHAAHNPHQEDQDQRDHYRMDLHERLHLLGRTDEQRWVGRG
jgi:hypothetical protein